MVSRHSVIDSADDDRRERKYLFTITALETCSIRETSDAYNQRYKNTFDRIRQQSVSLTRIDWTSMSGIRRSSNSKQTNGLLVTKASSSWGGTGPCSGNRKMFQWLRWLVTCPWGRRGQHRQLQYPCPPGTKLSKSIRPDRRRHALTACHDQPCIRRQSAFTFGIVACGCWPFTVLSEEILIVSEVGEAMVQRVWCFRCKLAVQFGIKQPRRGRKRSALFGNVKFWGVGGRVVRFKYTIRWR